MHICNKNQYGFMMGPYTASMTLEERHQMFIDIFIDYVGKVVHNTEKYVMLCLSTLLCEVGMFIKFANLYKYSLTS